MLNSIGVVIAIIVLFYMIVWLLKNDRAKTINDQHGQFAMRRIETDDDTPKDDPKPTRIRRPASSSARGRSSRTGR